MEIAISQKIKSEEIITDLIGKIGFTLLLFFLGIILYFDDIQITVKASEDIPTIYNIRFGGIKLMDFMSISLALTLLAYLIIKDKFEITNFHKNVFVIFGVYCYAAVIGFIYSFWLKYDYLNFIQDFQQVLYMTGYFLFTFYFVNSIKRWKIFFVSFIIFLVAKNIIILYKTFTGEGIVQFLGLVRASQNSEFAYFPIIFFVLIIFLFHKTNYLNKTLFLISLLIYLVNTIIGSIRTVWVVLFIGIIFLLFQIDKKIASKLFSISIISLILILISIYFINPLGFEYLWENRFLSIFDWSFSGNRSNAIRMIQISNVWDWVISHHSYLQGMGLGAWWEDNARAMLPNITTEYQQKSHFRKTDIWFVTQFLKIGLIGMFFYWKSILKILKDAKNCIAKIPKNNFLYKASMGLFVGLFASILSNADHVRLFLIIGIEVALFASLSSLLQKNLNYNE